MRVYREAAGSPGRARSRVLSSPAAALSGQSGCE